MARRPNNLDINALMGDAPITFGLSGANALSSTPAAIDVYGDGTQFVEPFIPQYIRQRNRLIAARIRATRLYRGRVRPYNINNLARLNGLHRYAPAYGRRQMRRRMRPVLRTIRDQRPRPAQGGRPAWPGLPVSTTFRPMRRYAQGRLARDVETLQGIPTGLIFDFLGLDPSNPRPARLPPR